jgi:macrophage erythroblast attacher
MLARMRGLKRKLNACSEEETRLHQQSQSRIRHLGELYGMQSLDDVKYEEWSRTRLDRLLVDYLLRYGYKDSATALSKEKGIEDLVDVETFVQMSRIRESLRNGRVTEALSWCTENKKELRRMEVGCQLLIEKLLLTLCRVILSSCYGFSNILSWYGHKTKRNFWNQ